MRGLCDTRESLWIKLSLHDETYCCCPDRKSSLRNRFDIIPQHKRWQGYNLPLRSTRFALSMIVVFNPVAGLRRASLLWRVLDVLVANGVRIELAETHRAGHAEALAREAACAHSDDSMSDIVRP